MGVPAFFRWLSKKYPCVIIECNENKVLYYCKTHVIMFINKRPHVILERGPGNWEEYL